MRRLFLSLLRWSSLTSASCRSFTIWGPKDCENVLKSPFKPYCFLLVYKPFLNPTARPIYSDALPVSLVQGGDDLQALRRSSYPRHELLRPQQGLLPLVQTVCDYLCPHASAAVSLRPCVFFILPLFVSSHSPFYCRARCCFWSGVFFFFLSRGDKRWIDNCQITFFFLSQADLFKDEL